MVAGVLASGSDESLLEVPTLLDTTLIAISPGELLKAFINIEAQSTETLAWQVGIHLTFVTSGVLFALSDRLSKSGNG